MLYLSVALGGAIGACLRFALGQFIARSYEGSWPWATFSVNIIGSFIIGFVFVCIHEKAMLPISYKPFIMSGFLGALTTYSSFSLETFLQMQQGQWLQALLYSVSSLLLCLIATVLAVQLARLL